MTNYENFLIFWVEGGISWLGYLRLKKIAVPNWGWVRAWNALKICCLIVNITFGSKILFWEAGIRTFVVGLELELGLGLEISVESLFQMLARTFLQNVC